MNITMCREEIRELLNITEDSLKGLIKRKTLDIKLDNVGYKLIKQFKLGRNTLYELQYIGISDWDEIQNKYKILKRDEHSSYSFIRLTKDGLTMPRNKILNECSIDISNTTARRYDDMLVEENAMSFDKVVYYKLIPQEDGSKLWEEITANGYKAFWIEQREAKMMIGYNKRRLNTGEISQYVYDLNIFNILQSVEREHGYMVVKFNTYKEAEYTKEIQEWIINKNKCRSC